MGVRHRIIVFVVMATHGSLSNDHPLSFMARYNTGWIQTLPVVSTSILEARIPVNGPQSTFNSERTLVVSCGAALVPLHHVLGAASCHPLNVVVVVFQYLILKQLHLLLVYFVYPILLNPVILISILRGHFSSLTYQLIKANDDDEDEDEREMTEHIPGKCRLFAMMNFSPNKMNYFHHPHGLHKAILRF